MLKRWNIDGRIGMNEVRERTPHAGLWLDKYLAKQPQRKDKSNEQQRQTLKGDEQQRQALMDEVTQIPTPPIYTNFFHTWEAGLAGAHAKTKRAHLLGCRLCIGLGTESVLETGITLHRTYGTPYIPGSALKGLAAHYARRRLGEAWKPEGDAYKILFGYAEEATKTQVTKSAAMGYVTFYDALYMPETPASALQADVLTVHHPNYYNNPGSNAAPADWDSPTIIPLLSATGAYLIALSGPDVWVDAAFSILNMALVEMGIGAKTSSGYGRMYMADVTLPKELLHFVQTVPAVPRENYALAKKRLLGEQAPTGRERGTVVKLPDARYGSIVRAKDGAKIFVHQNQLREAGGKLRDQQIVEYTIGPGEKEGQLQAKDVVILLEPGS